jgi:Restriction endonuclease
MRLRHLFVHHSEGWTNDQRGQYFEGFVADLLRPMRYEVRERLRVTGMEIDLLAKGLDQPRTLLVECKTQRDALPADTISKLLGNVAIRGADAGWLFSTSDLTKDGRGQWEEIQSRPELAAKFTWFPPERLIDILIDQKTVVNPDILLAQHISPNADFGDATLIWSPSGKFWLVEILQDGLPTFFTVFEGATGVPLAQEPAVRVAALSDRFATLEYQGIRASSLGLQQSVLRSPIARVVSGDTWDDLRPARPTDFVGRDDLIQDVLGFIDHVRDETTSTRTFAVQGPSGWGKSSLVIKLADLVSSGRRIQKCSLTAIDSRSATSAAFVTGALRLAFTDASLVGLIPSASSYEIGSLTHPLDSPDLIAAANHLAEAKSVIVLVFDQFEELFTKEALFETFNAIRDLSMDLDSRQLPIVLGFSWKTDVSLPQQHPAYHLWHSLADRRVDLGEILRSELKMSWKDTSSKRYANGIRRYYEWASANPQVIAD